MSIYSICESASSSVNFTQNKSNNNRKGDGKIKKSGKAAFCCFCFVVAVFFLVYLLFLPVYFGISSLSLSLFVSISLWQTLPIVHGHEAYARTHTNMHTQSL